MYPGSLPLLTTACQFSHWGNFNFFFFNLFYLTYGVAQRLTLRRVHCLLFISAVSIITCKVPSSCLQHGKGRMKVCLYLFIFFVLIHVMISSSR